MVKFVNCHNQRSHRTISLLKIEEESMFAILVKFTVSPEYRKQLIDALNEDRRGSLRDERKKGTIRFDIVYDAKNSNIFFLYEVYED